MDKEEKKIQTIVHEVEKETKIPEIQRFAKTSKVPKKGGTGNNPKLDKKND